MPRRRESESGNVLPFFRPPNRQRTLEIHCDNCQARFIAWYGTEEDADTDTIDVEKCGLCGGDPFKWIKPFISLCLSLTLFGLDVPNTLYAQNPTAPSEKASAVSPEAGASTPASRKPSEPEIVLGVQGITNQSDGTSESFDLTNYLQSHPLELKDKSVKVILVDSSGDADYAISGTLDGTVTVSWIWERPLSRFAAAMVLSPVAVPTMVLAGRRWFDVATYKYHDALRFLITTATTCSTPLATWRLTQTRVCSSSTSRADELFS